jgi:flagellar transcriptional activator FlhD
MDDPNLVNEIAELNLTYLLLAQRMLTADRASAMFRLHINDAMADYLSSLSASDLAKLSRTNQLLCTFSYARAEQLQAVTHPVRDQGLNGFHSSLLMASNAVIEPDLGER